MGRAGIVQFGDVRTAISYCYETGGGIGGDASTRPYGAIANGSVWQGTIDNSYYLSTLNINTETKDDNEKALTETEMKTQSSFEGWDFTDVWYCDGENYPQLRALMAEPHTFTIDDGYSSSVTTISMLPNETYTLSTLSRTNYTFEGWTITTDAGTSKSSVELVETSSEDYYTLTAGDGDATVTAQWAEKYTFTIESFSNSTYTTVKLSQGDTYSLPKLTRDDYTFTDWTITSDTGTSKSSITSGGSSYTLTAGDGDATVTAQWQKNILTITFDCESLTGEKYMAYVYSGDSIIAQIWLSSGEQTLELQGIDNYDDSNKYKICFVFGYYGNIDFTELTNATQTTVGGRSVTINTSSDATITYTIANPRINSTVIV